jgi:hypothetical protein
MMLKKDYQRQQAHFDMKTIAGYSLQATDGAKEDSNLFRLRFVF